jgi:hypothetical protein
VETKIGGEAPYELAEILPQSLQTLRLHVDMSQRNMNPESSPVWTLEIENKGIWLQKVETFVKTAESKHSSLEMIVLMGAFPYSRVAGCPLDSSFSSISAACTETCVNFQIIEFDGSSIKIAYFRELDEGRNLGRDF